MPYEVRWHVPNRVILIRDWGKFTIEEMRASNNDTIALMRAGQPPIHLLINALEIEHFPTSFRPLLQEIERFRHEPTMGWTVMITHNSLFHFFGVMSSNITKTSFRAANSLEEAHAILIKVDSSLAGLLPVQQDAVP